MPTNHVIDPDVVDRALEVGVEPSKEAANIKAPREFMAHRAQLRVPELFGEFDRDASFDYKAERTRRS